MTAFWMPHGVLLFFVLLALAAFERGYTAFRRALRQKKDCSARVSGKIVTVFCVEGSPGQTHAPLYYPVYEYEVDGIIYHYRSEFGSLSSFRYRIGRATPLRYNPAHPEDCCTGWWGQLGAGVNWLSGAFALVLLIGSWFLQNRIP